MRNNFCFVWQNNIYQVNNIKYDFILLIVFIYFLSTTSTTSRIFLNYFFKNFFPTSQSFVGYQNSAGEHNEEKGRQIGARPEKKTIKKFHQLTTLLLLAIWTKYHLRIR